MARTTATKTNEAVNKEPEEIREEELNLDKLVTLRSIANWTTGFARKTTQGDVSIAPKGLIRLTRNEVIAQAQTPNSLITGENGTGDHPTLIIEDEPTRHYLGFDNAKVFSNDVVTELFKINNQEEFENAVKDAIVTRAEKHSVMTAVLELGLNDYSKIRFLENYTGYRMDRLN